MAVHIPADAAAAVAAGGSGALALFVHPTDAVRGEGLFSALAPILERGARSSPDGGATPKRIVAVVLLPGASADAVEAAARRLIGEKEWAERADVTYHTLEGAAGTVPEALASAAVDVEVAEREALASAATCDVAAAPVLSAADVAAAAFTRLPTRAFRDAAVGAVAESVKNRSGAAVPPLLLLDFGARVDAVLVKAMEEFDASVEKMPALVKKSSVVAARRRELREDIIGRIHGTVFDGQVRELALACEEDFHKSISRLRITPNLPSDMDKCAADAVADYKTRAAGLIPQCARGWDAGGGAADLGPRCREYVRRKLAAATVQGSYKPAPRKAVSLGFHYLMPEGPFADDYRRPTDGMVSQEGTFVYTPAGRRNEVGAADAATWGQAIAEDKAKAGTLPGASGNTANYMVKMGAGTGSPPPKQP